MLLNLLGGSTPFLAASTAAVSSQAGCHDAPGHSCANLTPSDCARKVADVRMADEAFAENAGAYRVWQLCPQTCNRCTQISRCAWILQLSASDLLPAADIDALNSQLLDLADERLTASNASEQPSHACHVRPEYFYHYQNAHPLPKVSSGLATLRSLMHQGAARWLQAVGSTNSASSALEPAESIAGGFSHLAPEECHPEHDHVKDGLCALSLVYYANADPETHAPILFRDPEPRGVDGASLFNCSYVRDTPIRAHKSRKLALRPRSGTLLVFPRWLRHEVPPDDEWKAFVHGPHWREACAAGEGQISHIARRRAAYAANVYLAPSAVQRVRQESHDVHAWWPSEFDVLVRRLGLPPVVAGPQWARTHVRDWADVETRAPETMVRRTM